MSQKTIKSINPVSAATVAAVLTLATMFAVFLPLGLIFSITGLSNFSNISGGLEVFGGGIVLFFIMPFFYAGIVFLMTLISAFIYNVTFRFHKGYKIEFLENDEDITQIGNH